MSLSNKLFLAVFVLLLHVLEERGSGDRQGFSASADSLSQNRLNDDMVEKLLLDCGVDRKDIGEFLKGLSYNLFGELIHASRHIHLERKLYKGTSGEVISFVSPEIERCIFECLSKRNIPLAPGSGNHGSTDYCHYIDSLLGHSPPRRYLANQISQKKAPDSAQPSSPDTVTDGREDFPPPPAAYHILFPLVSKKTQDAPLDATKKQSNKNSSAVIIGVVFIIVGTSIIAAFLFVFYKKCSEKNGYSRDTLRDDRPLLGLSTGDFPGSSHNSYGMQSSLEKDISSGHSSFKAESVHLGHVSSFAGDITEPPAAKPFPEIGIPAEQFCQAITLPPELDVIHSAAPPAPPTMALPVTEAAPPVPEAAPPVQEAAPPVPEAAPPVPEAAPPVPEAAPPVPIAAPPVPEAAPPVPEATPPVPVAAPPPPVPPPPPANAPPLPPPQSPPPPSSLPPPPPSSLPPPPSLSPPLPPSPSPPPPPSLSPPPPPSPSPPPPPTGKNMPTAPSPPPTANKIPIAPHPPPPPQTGNNMPTAPSPPPPPGGKKPGAGPPPPPPKATGPPRPPSKNASRPPSIRRGSEDFDTSDGKAKLKPFFWDKVVAHPDQSMVWDQIKAGSFQFNEEMIETLFCYTPATAKPKTDEKEATSKGPQIIRILDPKKSQNLAISLKALNVKTQEVCRVIMEGGKLPAELVQTVLKMAPTTDEELKLRLFSGDLLELGPAEQFLKVLVDVPFAFERLDCLLFMSCIPEEVSTTKESFSIIEAASEELKSSRLFLKLLEAVLKTGNRMNSGTYRGGAQAFKLDTLLKLADVKGTDNKTTLLHFVVQEIIRSEGVRAVRVAREQNRSIFMSEDLTGESPHESEDYFRKVGLKVVSGLGDELENVKKAAGLDADALANTVASLGHRLIRARDFLNKNMKSLEEESGFKRSLELFIEQGGPEISLLQEQEKRTKILVQKTTDFFHGKEGKDEGLKLFVTVKNFLGMLDKACKEVRETPRVVAPPKGKDKEAPSPSASPARDPRELLFPAIKDRRVDSSSSDDDS